MIKKYASMVLSVILLLSALSFRVCAVSNEAVATEVIPLEDGGYLEVTIVQSMARSTKSGNKYYTYKDSAGAIKWQAILSATFSYDGTTSSCTSSACSVSVYDSSWSLASKYAYRSGNTAYASVTMSYTTAGVETSRSTYKLSLSCDENGNLS